MILPILTFYGIKRRRDIFNKPDYQYFVENVLLKAHAAQRFDIKISVEEFYIL